jgi:DNA-binding MarR family transcriptional regulator
VERGSPGRITHLITGIRQHERLMEMAGVRLDRAVVALLRQIADSGPLRSGELAHLLAVEASHVTRQVQQLQKAGHVTRVPDPDDRRAHGVQLTPAGQEAIDRIVGMGAHGMRLAMADWSPEELRKFAVPLHRMLDDFFRGGAGDAAEGTFARIRQELSGPGEAPVG